MTSASRPPAPGVPAAAGELDALLAGEIERWLPVLRAQGEGAASTGRVRTALHALRGSAGMAGHAELGLVLAQVSERVRAGDAEVLEAAVRLLTEAAARLRRGHPPLEARWPEPPPLLRAEAVPEVLREEYQRAAGERLDELGALAEREGLDVGAALRVVHGLKGSASSAGDVVTAWYCHGLEGELGTLRERPEQARVRLQIHRSVLVGLVADPEAGMGRLRAVHAVSAPAPGPGEARAAAPAAGRVAPPRLDALSDRLLERVERADLVREALHGLRARERTLGGVLRGARAALLEALRLIGPPRPWGAPAPALARVERAAGALVEAAAGTDEAAAELARHAEELGLHLGELRTEIADSQSTTLEELFAGVARAARRAGEELGHPVVVTTRGTALKLDRRVAEQLATPLAQLARNAVAHGLGTARQRLAEGRPPVGTVELRAERRGDWLELTVADDGRGADLGALRRLAVDRGGRDPAWAERASESDLLRLLFLPGFTTRSGADLLAGQGVGLDLVQDLVGRVGGTVQLRRRSTGGLAAVVDVPGQRGMAEVLWVSVSGVELGLPVSYARRARPGAGDVSLAACLGLAASAPETHAVELAIPGVDGLWVGVERLGRIEAAVTRVLPRAVSSAGPWSGAVLRPDGALRLVVDPVLLAGRAWALAPAAPAG